MRQNIAYPHNTYLPRAAVGVRRAKPVISRRRPCEACVAGPITTDAECERDRSPGTNNNDHLWLWGPAQGRDDADRVARATLGFDCQRARHASAFSRRDAPEVCVDVVPPGEQRAQGRPGARCTRGLACKCTQQKRTRAYRFSGNNRPSLRNGFTAYFVLSPVNGFLATVAAQKLAARLDASTAASGPHDFAVRLTPRSSVALSRPPHLTARS